jgi:hypothetical protein
LIYSLQFQLVPTIISRVSDPHPRVRYNALHCLETLTNQFTGEENDDEEDDDNEEKSFQELFPHAPTAVCSSIQLNFAHPRIVYAGLNTLKSFFDPDICTTDICNPYGGGILDFCSGLLSSEVVPYFVKGECASVIGNVSILSNEILNVRYDNIINTLKKIIFLPVLENQKEDNHEMSLLKAKCLESVALVGKAAGVKTFLPVAHELLEMFVLAHQQVRLWHVFMYVYLFMNMHV